MGKHLGLLFLLLLCSFSSCDRKNDALIGRWTVEKVNVDFDENIATPEMVRMLGEIEKGNVVEISKDSLLLFISDGDTMRSSCSLRGETLYFDGKPFARFSDGELVTEDVTPLGRVTVKYKRGE